MGVTSIRLKPETESSLENLSKKLDSVKSGNLVDEKKVSDWLES